MTRDTVSLPLQIVLPQVRVCLEHIDGKMVLGTRIPITEDYDLFIPEKAMKACVPMTVDPEFPRVRK